MDLQLLLIPICYKNHWTIIEVRPLDHSIRCHNSLGNEGDKGKMDLIEKYLREESMNKHGGETRAEEWVSTSPDVPQQSNMTDCGVFMLVTAQALILKEKLEMHPDQAPYHRLRIMMSLRKNAILQGGLKGITEPPPLRNM